MFRRCIVKLLYGLMLLFVVLMIISFQQAKHPRRDSASLMVRYEALLKHGKQAEAKQALYLILKHNPRYVPALNALKRLSLVAHRDESTQPLPLRPSWFLQAITPPYLSQSFQHADDLNISDELAKSMKIASVSDCDLKPKAKHPVAMAPLDSFYLLLKHDKSAALHAIRRINQHPPYDVRALTEGGYVAMALGHRYEAIDYFEKAYVLSQDPALAMQLGYLYEQVSDKPKAYHYFQLATRGKNPSLAFKAENQMTALSGLQTKALPEPYFTEIFFTPFSQSRFGLTVTPFLARYGIEQANRLHSKLYLLFRRTQDNRSENLGQISQLYEDDVQIIGGGGQITPFERLPITAYLETGAAYDLIYQNRNRWRGDVRGGVMYYSEFGARPGYFEKWTIGHAYFGDIYGDATYFSRYNNNVIGGVRTHQGIRLLQYHSSMVNVYVTGRVIGDSKRIFYNNFAEMGPGIAFTPSNRFNVQLRVEHLNGMYLPAGAIANPYGKYYTNNLAQLLLYVKI